MRAAVQVDLSGLDHAAKMQIRAVDTNKLQYVKHVLVPDSLESFLLFLTGFWGFQILLSELIEIHHNPVSVSVGSI